MRVRPLVDVVAQLSARASSAGLWGLAGEGAGSVCVCVCPSTGRLSLINVCEPGWGGWGGAAHAHNGPSTPLPPHPNTPKTITLRVNFS